MKKFLILLLTGVLVATTPARNFADTNITITQEAPQKFYNENGEILWEGYVNTYAPDGGYYDENSTQVNPSEYNNIEEIERKVQDFEQGRYVLVKNKKEMYAFLDYYYVQYQLNKQGIIIQYTDTGAGRWLELPKKWMYDRDAVVKLILDTYGKVQGETVAEKVQYASNAMNSLVYRETYVERSITDAIKDGYAVCFHYARIMNVLLNDAGVENEVIVVKPKNFQYNHMIVRSKDENGKWIYSDPTAVASGQKESWNMPYQSVMDSYVFVSSYIDRVI